MTSTSNIECEYIQNKTNVIVIKWPNKGVNPVSMENNKRINRTIDIINKTITITGISLMVLSNGKTILVKYNSDTCTYSFYYGVLPSLTQKDIRLNNIEAQETNIESIEALFSDIYKLRAILIDAYNTNLKINILNLGK